MESIANFERGRWKAVEERKRKCRKGVLSHSTGMKIFLCTRRARASRNVLHNQNAMVLRLSQ